MLGEFETAVKRFIDAHLGISPDAGKVIVALSGGADSVALLSVMTALGYDCVAAHCNFGLRGAESERDMVHAETVASGFGAVFESVRFDVPARCASTGESVEMACRELRYAWFDTLKEKYSAQALLTGHHRGDNIETMFLNLLRGAGLRGVAGISPAGDRRMSPMLMQSRDDILRYLAGRNLDYVTDSSNLTTDYQRNKIRLEVIPAFEREFPDAAARIGRSLVYLDEDRRLLDAAVDEWRHRYMPDGRTVDLHVISGIGPLAGAVLFKLLAPLGFSRIMTDAMLGMTDVSGRVFESRSHRACIDRGRVILQPIEHDSEQVSVSVRLIPARDFRPEHGKAYFDASVLEGNPQWELRQWREGDRMRPFGMNGRSKKISDIFNDMKIPVADKCRSLMLTRDGEILWAVGYRASESFRVMPDTATVAVMEINGDGSPLCGCFR